MMPRHRLAPRRIHRRMDPIAGLQPVRGDSDPVPDRLTLWLDVGHASTDAIPGQHPVVRRLPASFRVKGCLV